MTMKKTSLSHTNGDRTFYVVVLPHLLMSKRSPLSSLTHTSKASDEDSAAGFPLLSVGNDAGRHKSQPTRLTVMRNASQHLRPV